MDTVAGNGAHRLPGQGHAERQVDGKSKRKDERGAENRSGACECERRCERWTTVEHGSEVRDGGKARSEG